MRYQKILILGPSGSGKTMSLRNLSPVRTGIINTDQQELVFGMEGYNMQTLDNGRPDLANSNYVETGRPASVVATLKAWEEREDLDVIVLDTITHLITNYYVNDALGKEFGGYKELGTSFFNIVDTVRRLNKHVIIFGHIKTSFNDLGNRVTTMKSHGKMIDDFEPESFFNTLLLAEVRSIDNSLTYSLRTQPENPSEKLKSPVRFGEENQIIRALEKYEPNDVNALLQKLNNFYNN